ncbi:hypothetical protein L1D44_12075, partial [Shewanella sp. Isolate13]|uniref:hypothetical protein n=1 Tax=Shewanella sp. Isolate13 TaxID=2908531 RepID=UPI001EFCD867
RLGFMIYSLFIIFFFFSMDGNADYLVDRIPGSNGFVYDYYVTILFFLMLLLGYTNFRMSSEAKKHRKRISAMVDGIILELEKLIDIDGKS